MTPITRVYRTNIPASPDELMAWHASPAAFERLTPPWRKVEVLECHGTIYPGDRKTIHLPLAGPLGVDWTLRHEALEGVTGFADVQVAGPFRSWRHEHRFLPDGPNASVLEDRLTWELPRGASVAGARVERELDRLFAFRHDRTRHDLDRLAGADPNRALRIAVTGASGLVGSRLTAFLRAGGHEVFPLVRGRADGSNDIHWDPAAGEIDAAKLEGMDAVVHLAGASIAGGLWTRKRKNAIRDSRVLGTHLLAKTLAGLDRPPSVLVSTSAVGYYGSRGDEVLTETSAPGEGFLSDVVQEWEDAATPASRAGIRVVHPRFGVVLAGEGGMLPLISLPFRLGVGGPLGSGKQYFSWIAIDDLVGVLFESIVNPDLEGPVNAVAQQETTNAEFTRTLAHVLHRPAFFRVPAGVMKLVAGQLAEEVILVSQRVRPSRLADVGFPFAFPTLEQVLRNELGRIDSKHVTTGIDLSEAHQRVA
jgi:uncharacterized protein (TIGR01777 family)